MLDRLGPKRWSQFHLVTRVQIKYAQEYTDKVNLLRAAPEKSVNSIFWDR